MFCTVNHEVIRILRLAGVRILTETGELNKEVRKFSTMTRDLLALSDWLRVLGCTHVAMESTGVYWKPVYNLLEDSFELLLVTAQHMKAVPGRKTDVLDAEWIAFHRRHEDTKKNKLMDLMLSEN